MIKFTSRIDINRIDINIDTQKGIGLIEVLVSLLILAVSLLGYLAVQANALELTSESSERTQSLALMRSLGEKIRANPAAKEAYADELKYPGTSTNSNTSPGTSCGLLSATGATLTAALCNANTVAKEEIYIAKKELLESGYILAMVQCPGSGGGVTSPDGSSTFSYCLIAAWGDTVPTVKGAPATINNYCIDETGGYRADATCMIMELT